MHGTGEGLSFINGGAKPKLLLPCVRSMAMMWRRSDIVYKHAYARMRARANTRTPAHC